MKFLLINTNQIVQKLVEITAKKAGANLTTITESSQLTNLEQYDYILVDDDCFRLDSQAYTEALKDKRKCLIYNKQDKRIEGFDDYVQKPFLPTSILDIFTAQLSRQAPVQNPEATALDSVDSALGAEFDAALNGEILDNTENAPIGLDNLNDGLGEIDNLLDDSLESTESSLEDSNNTDSSDDSKDTQTENKEAMPEEPTLDIEQATDELNPEATLDEGLDIDLDLSNLDELDDFSNDENAENAESMADSNDLGDLGELAQDESLTDSASDMASTQTEVESQAEKDELSLEELDLAGEVAEDSKNSTQESIETESQATDLREQAIDDLGELGDLGDLESEVANLDSTQENTEQKTQKATEAQDTESSQNELDELGNLDALEDTNELENINDIANSDDLAVDSLQDDEIADLDNLGSLEGLEDDLEQDANLDSLAETQQDTNETSNNSTDSIENLDLESLGEDSIDVENAESLNDLGNETHLDELDSLNDSSAVELENTQEAMDSHTPLDEEFSSEGLLENDLLDNIEKVALNEPVLDKEQVSEVSKALQAIDEEGADFTSLKEPEVAQALGEELPEELLSLNELSESHDETPDESLENISLDSQDMTESTPTQNNQEQNAQPQEIVKNMIANSVQSSISSLSSNNLKSMLDGLEVTINISFKDKSK